MNAKRLLALFGAFVLAFSVVLGRCYVTAGNQTYAAAAEGQRITNLPLEGERGGFYDANGVPLTGKERQYYALCIPGESSYARLFHLAAPGAQNLLYTRRNAAEPFLIPVSGDLSNTGVYTYAVPKRYLKTPIACHLLGYLNGEGEGVAGLELAYEEVLHPAASSYIQCVTNAKGALLNGQPPKLYSGTEHRGVRLTLREEIQRACEGIARSQMTSGCILVLETGTGRILASVSLPEFDPEYVAASIQADDTSLLNRPFCAFNVGSVFKPVLAAAALEQGLDWFTHTCVGYVEVDGHIYRCAQGIPHGTVNLRQALEQSCNCYFVRLGQQLGGQTVWEMARRLGFGQAVYLSAGMKTVEGTLPGPEVLENTGQLAGLSFGQGQLTAAPLQIAAFMDTIASGGSWHSPFVVEGLVNEADGNLLEKTPAPAERRVLERADAERLQDMLATVVGAGNGSGAQPTFGTAAGKTGTAQTGRYNEQGEEQLNFWFAGFYPAEEPHVTVVVMQDGQAEAPVSSAAVFRQVCDALHFLLGLSESSTSMESGGTA